MTFYVWVLVFYIGGSREGGPTIIDNISSMQECERVRTTLIKRSMFTGEKYTAGQCIKVEKKK